MTMTIIFDKHCVLKINFNDLKISINMSQPSMRAKFSEKNVGLYANHFHSFTLLLIVDPV